MSGNFHAHKRGYPQYSSASKRFCPNQSHISTNPKDIPLNTKKSLKIQKFDRGNNWNSSTGSIDVYLPQGVNVYRYAESRALEMKNLKKALSESGSTLRSFQQLPRHMRRRAASHNAKRVPTRLRSRAVTEMDEVTSNKKLRKSRKYKKGPESVSQEYTRRSRKSHWLETHIWHAKRFKMIDKWGYKIAQQPCDKSFRATYRASLNTCLMQDKSFMQFIEVVGTEENIFIILKLMCATHSVNKLETKELLTGQHYVEIILYNSNEYPFKIIGPVKCIWTNTMKKSHKKLIMMCHPSITTEILTSMKSISTDEKFSIKIEDEANAVEKCYADTTYQQHEVEEFVIVKKLVLQFAVFSLTGPLSHSILKNAITLPGNDEEDEEVAEKVSHETGNQCANEIWKHLTDSDLRKFPNAILNLIVEDPRFHIPYNKQNPCNTSSVKRSWTGSISNTFDSALWDEDVRQIVKESKSSDHKINTMRLQLLVPGSKIPESSPTIPIVILQKPDIEVNGTSRANSGGFDIILPAGWAMPFWISFIYQGARAGGLREDKNIHLEGLIPYFPSSFPDSSAAMAEADISREEQEKTHWKYSPQNRRNYDIIGIKNPFWLPWQDLLNEWKYNTTTLLPSFKFVQNYDRDKFYVLRDDAMLNKLNRFFKQGSQHGKSVDVDGLLQHANSLVPIRIYAVNRGCPETNACLYIPTEHDVINFKKKQDGGLSDQDVGPMEPRHRGLKRTFPYICKQHGILRHNARTIGANTRWIIGYVQHGRYSLARGKGAAVGFVSLVGLFYLLTTNIEHQLLFRNIDTLQYRFCNFEILTD